MIEKSRGFVEKQNTVPINTECEDDVTAEPENREDVTLEEGELEDVEEFEGNHQEILVRSRRNIQLPVKYGNYELN